MQLGVTARTGRHARRLARRDRGGISVLSLQMLLCSLIVGGFAVDVGNAFQTWTQLQATADSAAHAALWSREWNSADTAKAKAIEVAENMMPPSRYGNVLTPEDIVFGSWNAATDTFTPSATSKGAVFVSTRRYASRNNSLGTWFLRLAGQDEFDIAAGSVFETYLPGCAREGFMAEGRVDTQSNNTYLPGFCVHSQTHVEVNSNSVFETGSVVSMPDKANLVMPASGFNSNIGLERALRDASYALRVLDRVNHIEEGLLDPDHPKYGIMTPGSPYYRSYITNASLLTVAAPKGNKSISTSFKTGRVHQVTCNGGNGTLTIDGDWFRQMALVTNCQIKFANGTTLEDAVILSTNTDKNNAVSSSQNIIIGKDDGCAPGGDVQILSLGSIKMTSGVEFYGSQLISAQDIALTANTNGVEGISLVAGGEIDVTSNGAYGYCAGAGMGNNYDASYFRMVN
ncbi:pilus assembly protein TadG-related protein [Albidovulum sediminis]|uniref:Pilus assembly protein TadG-related protein n=1 Tax=Albidovulum sediminis TaxID=3066345 RepID=A0ABT2NL53_9RHOB|nr:pilus assembly protein TadG-related protein [Defluviimonas sediminis]MCT8329491.1 pilus assembly protein TadG-related protein [Defluviimonas sediminis]